MNIRHILNVILVSTFFLLPSFVFAQYNNADTILLRPYGDDYREPKLYFEGTPKTNTSVSATAPKNEVPQNTAEPIVDPIFSGFNNKKAPTRLKLDVSGEGRTCKAGTVTASAWRLDPEVTISDGPMLKAVVEEALGHDYRIRRIVINEEKLDIYVLQPAKIFGFIPVNYPFHIKVDANTFEFRLENPKWLRYAKSDHANVADSISGNISTSLTKDRIDQLTQESLYHRHAVLIEKISTAFYLTPVYPYADTFWICVFIPYFFLFLILIGFIVGYILYHSSKRRRKRRARQLLYGGAQEYEPSPKREEEAEEDDELDRLIKAKKESQNSETSFDIRRPRM